VVFQPHRYTRTRDLFEDFLVAFHEADLLILTEIYSAGEDQITGITAERLAHAIRSQGHPSVFYIERQEEIVEKLEEVAQPGDIVLTLGAGDIWQVGEAFLRPQQKRMFERA
jgi:UDP-N-acetylmuramate--alanine ligase